jgi:N4-(beta-N-acetylglucosaminyl)-L-asparaginase
MEALKRVAANTVEKRLLNDRGRPMFDLKFYVLDRQGRYAGVAMHGGKDKSYAVCTEEGPRTLSCDVLFEEPDTE